jgi:CHAD domain-containing protein
MKEIHFDLPITVSDFAHRVIQQSFQHFIDQEESVLKDKDPESLHQMRVGMRRLRTALQVFSKAIALPKGTSNSSIGKIARSLGETRDLDVLQHALMNRYQPLLTKSEQTKFDKVINHLHQKRGQSFLKLKKALNGDRYQTLKQAIQDWLVQPTYTAIGHVSVLEILPDLLLPLVCQLFLHSGWLVGTTMEAGKVSLIPIANNEELHRQLRKYVDDLHDLRKQIKSVRYQTDFFADFYEPSYLERIEELKSMQEILGQLQDHAVLRHFLESILKADLAKVLPTIDQAIRQDTDSFWQNWQPLQATYLSLEFRQALRSLLISPLP